CGAQQMLIVSAVRLMAGGAALRPGWLMQVSLLHLVCLIAVAGQAGVDWIRLNESRALPAMRIVAGDAFARGARMLYLRGLDLLGLIFVTGQAKSAAVTIGQDDLALLRGLVTAVAHLVLERVVQECLHQLRFRGLVRVVALQTIRGSERLPLVSLQEGFIFRVMALDAEGRHRLLQMCGKLELPTVAVLVRHVAGIATHIESCVTASALGNIDANFVAGEAEVVVARGAGR